MINPLAIYRTLDAVKGLAQMDKTQIAALLRKHGPSAVTLAATLAAAINTDKTILPDVADALDGTASVPGVVFKHFGLVGQIIAIVNADPALLADIRTLVPHK